MSALLNEEENTRGRHRGPVSVDINFVRRSVVIEVAVVVVVVVVVVVRVNSTIWTQ